METVMKGLGWLVEQLRDLVLAIFEGLQTFGDGLLTSMLGVVQAATGWDPAAISGGLSQANYLLPVSEAVAFMAAYWGLWAVVVSYRFVKSWIPTVSGS